MNDQKEAAEFVGGPKDGLVVDIDYIRKLEERLDADRGEKIPMMYDEEASVADALEAEFTLLGRYVYSAANAGRVIYRWQPISE